MNRQAAESSSVCFYNFRFALFDLKKLADQDKLEIFLSVVEDGGVDLEQTDLIEFNLYVMFGTFSPDLSTNVFER